MGGRTKQISRSVDSRGQKTILVVDDHHVILEALAMLLANAGFSVATASNGEEALAIHAEIKPDLIITDLAMPQMNGLDLIKTIRMNDKTTLIAVLTAHGSLDCAVEALKLGANDFWVKMDASSELISKINNLLNVPPLELENRRLRHQVSALTEANTTLNERLAKQNNTTTKDVNTHQDKTLYHSLVHSMNNEFIQLGGSLREIRKIAVDSAEIQEECDRIERSLHYFRQLLNHLKSPPEPSEMRLEPISITDLIKRADFLIRPRIPSNILFEVMADPSISEGNVLANAEQLVGVLIEITNNAVHALSNSEGVIKLDFSVRDNMLNISVSNNGPSVPEEILEKLFKEQVRSSKEKGTGMGLLLARQVLNYFGGDIFLQESSPAQVTFKIQLPLDKTKDK